MVFFTCNACGQTVKKTKVEKHYQTECRDCTVLSCLDCGKDFYGDDYASHTSCISEAEKYQGKLYKDPNRGQPPKGEKKQLVWLEKVKQAAVASPATNPKLSRLLERLQEYTNIPRKMKKFQNFVRNSLNVRDQKTLDELWSMFSGLQAGCDGMASTKADNDKKPETSMLEDSTNDKVEADKVEKKKKKRHSEIDNDGVATTGVDNDEKAETSVLEDGTVTVDGKAEADKMKKKKKKKRHSEIDNDGIATTETDNDKKPETSMLEDSTDDKVEADKMKKKKKKRHSEIDIDGVATTGVDNDEKAETSMLEDGMVTVDNKAEGDKMKKKKKKHFETDHTEVVGDESMAVSEEDVLSSTKKHKKTHHSTDSEDVTGNTNQLDIQLLSDSQPPVIDESVIKKRKKSKKKSPEQEVQCISDQQDTTKDIQHTGTDNAVEDNISHWISSIIDSGAVKKKDKRRQCNDDSVATDQSFTACTNVDSTKKSKSKQRDVDNQAVMEDSKVMVVEQKKKRKSRATVELQAADDETEIPLVKKHKKKK